MAKQSINIGATANDTNGDSIRAAFKKVNENFTDLYTTTGSSMPGPYADDAAAAASGVAVGHPYFRSTGQVFVRLA